MIQMKTMSVKFNNFSLPTFINLVYKYSSFRDAVKLFGLIILLILVIYISPEFVKISFLSILLISFFYSKPRYDYFWIIIALVLVDNPSNLFWLTTDGIFKIGIAKFSYLNVFSILSLIKVLNGKRYPQFPSFLKKPFQFYLIFLFIVIINGLAIGIEGGGRTGFRYLYYFSQIFLMLPLFYSLPKMLYDESSLLKFFNLIFILIIFNFIGQVFSVLEKQNIHFLLGGTAPKDWESIVSYEKVDLIRPMFGIYIIFFGFIASFCFYFSRLNYFNKKYLISIGIICFLSILITATRGWIIAYTLFLLMVLFHSMRNRYSISFFKKALLILIPTIIFITLNKSLTAQFNNIFDRLATMELLYKGDPTLGGTNFRLTDRSRPVMTKFYEKPLLGWGASGVGMKTWDQHVGNQSILMIGGILGYSAIFSILIYFMLKLYMMSKKLDNDNIYKNSLIILVFSFIVLIIIHSSSSQIFGYLLFAVKNYKGLILSIFFAMINNFYLSSLRNDIQIAKTINLE